MRVILASFSILFFGLLTSCAEETIPDKQVHYFLQAYWQEDWERLRSLSSQSMIDLIDIIESTQKEAEMNSINALIPFHQYKQEQDLESLSLSIEELSETHATVIAAFPEKSYRFYLRNEDQRWKIHIPDGPMWAIAEEL